MGYELASGTTQLIAQRAIDNTHTQIFSVAAILCVLLTVIPAGSDRPLSWQRKFFWTAAFSAAACAFIAGLPNLRTAISLAMTCLVITATYAYFHTQYLKIGGRLLAAQNKNGFPESAFGAGQDPYSPSLSAAKMWWLVVMISAAGSVGLLGYVIDDSLLSLCLGLGAFLVVGIMLGYMDGTDDQRVARGQYLPFAICGVASAGIFALAYLITYRAALRRSESER